MVFQNYAIYPTMTVGDNVEFGLKNNHIPKAERMKRVNEACEKVGMSEYLDRKPGTLSGGQRQRVALARAIVKSPSVFLMDEPLSNLDAKLRVQMRVELIELHNKLKTTFVYVTHDQVEAMSMADTIVLMNKGTIMQMASPSVMYRDPDNLFTARFIGSPTMNVKKLDQEGNMLGFRPEKGIISTERCEGGFNAEGTIIAKELLGSEVLYSVRDKSGTVYVIKTENEDYQINQEVFIGANLKHIYLFGANEQRIREDNQGYAILMGAVRSL
jgi:sn-glycerol 3-phosphate transport system ATP-binding protein